MASQHPRPSAACLWYCTAVTRSRPLEKQENRTEGAFSRYLDSRAHGREDIPLADVFFGEGHTTLLRRWARGITTEPSPQELTGVERWALFLCMRNMCSMCSTYNVRSESIKPAATTRMARGAGPEIKDSYRSHLRPATAVELMFNHCKIRFALTSRAGQPLPFFLRTLPILTECHWRYTSSSMLFQNVREVLGLDRVTVLFNRYWKRSVLNPI